MSTSYKAKGFLINKGATEQKKDTFKAREFVLSQPGEYPNKMKFQLVQDNCVLLDPVAEGSEIEVDFSIKGSEKDGKVWNNLNAWGITVTKAAVTLATAAVEDDAPF